MRGEEEEEKGVRGMWPTPTNPPTNVGESHREGQKTVKGVKGQQQESVCVCVNVAPAIVSHQCACVCVCVCVCARLIS